MRRTAPTLIGLLLSLAATAAPVAAQRILQIAFVGTGTAAVEGCVEGGDPPCAETTIVSVSTTVSGSPSPFSEIKRFKPGTVALSGTLLVSNGSFDSGTGCYTTMLGTLTATVGRNQREAFALDVTGPFCPGGFSGTFQVDSSGTDYSMFRGAVGTGTFDMEHGLDLSTRSTSSAELRFNGQITVRR